MSKQYFKALYLDDYPTVHSKKTFAIAFNESEFELYSAVAPMSTYDILQLIKCDSYGDIKKCAEKDNRSINNYVKLLIKNNIKCSNENVFQKKDVTFSNSKSIPFQRWYPYLEGYSPRFVTNLIDKYCENSSLIYEPFAGTGTTIFSADNNNIKSVYSEVNPLLRFLIKVKLHILGMLMDERLLLANELFVIRNEIFEHIKHISPSVRLDEAYKNTFGDSAYFPEEQYVLVLKIKTYIESLYSSNKNDLADLLTIATFACLLPISYLKKQGDVRFKTEKERQNEQKLLQDILPIKIDEIAEDISNMFYASKFDHNLLCDNAKEVGKYMLNEKISDVITSPPYLNGTNYFRNTKLELWFIGKLSSKDDLRKYRDETLTSGINDVKKSYQNEINNFNSELYDNTILQLQEKAYDSRIPLMAKCYFSEMAKVFDGLTIHLKDNANVLIDLGDSIFSNVHIKTDYILVEILKEYGYSLKDRIVLRQRRSQSGDLLTQVLLVMKYNKYDYMRNK